LKAVAVPGLPNLTGNREEPLIALKYAQEAFGFRKLMVTLLTRDTMI